MESTNSETVDTAPPRPSACEILDGQRILLVRSRGKALTSNESFGYRIDGKRYLYLEEVIYLFDRGVLDVSMNGRDLSLRDLYSLLPKFGIPLPIVLLYQHLRAQTFYTLRHHPIRHRILQQIEERFGQLDASTPRNSKTMQQDQRLSQLRQQLREHTPIDLTPTHALVFDCYTPGRGPFSSACPGIPDYCVAMTHFSSFGSSALQFNEIQSLRREAATALKIAVVSDAGIVIMLGVTNDGVPCLEQPTTGDGSTTNTGTATK